MMRSAIMLAAVIGVAVSAGCGSSPKANFYTLAADAAPAAGDSKTTYTVAIGAVSIPEMVDRPQFVVRTGTNQVAINEFERWAGSLKTEIGSAVAGNLMQQIPGANIYAYPHGAALTPDCRVTLEVQRFDSTPNEAALIEVLWTVQPAKGAARAGRTVARVATGGAGYDALVVAHGRALAQVSNEIAAAIKSVKQ